MTQTEANQKFCAEQIDRLQGSPFFDTLNDLVIKDLVEALQDAAHSQDEARLIITTWKRTHREYPTVADIWESAAILQAGEKLSLPPPCDSCTEGRIIREMTVTRGVFAGEVHNVADFCDCPLGQALRERQK